MSLAIIGKFAAIAFYKYDSKTSISVVEKANISASPRISAILNNSPQNISLEFNEYFLLICKDRNIQDLYQQFLVAN